jgi:hypothetical protein
MAGGPDMQHAVVGIKPPKLHAQQQRIPEHAIADPSRPRK